jgi:hypothetical protein
MNAGHEIEMSLCVDREDDRDHRESWARSLWRWVVVMRGGGSDRDRVNVLRLAPELRRSS